MSDVYCNQYQISHRRSHNRKAAIGTDIIAGAARKPHPVKHTLTI
jgi:hypothetical protein